MWGKARYSTAVVVVVGRGKWGQIGEEEREGVAATIVNCASHFVPLDFLFLTMILIIITIPIKEMSSWCNC